MDTLTSDDIERDYHALARARETGDKLTVELAQATLNDTLDRYFHQRHDRVSQLSQVTSTGGTR